MTRYRPSRAARCLLVAVFLLAGAPGLGSATGLDGASVDGKMGAGDGEATPPQRVLFIGNSLTYVNDLPAMLAALAEAAGVELEVEAVTAPNYGLRDHWQGRDARRALRRGDWDWVVLQQGPSSLPESRQELVHMSCKLAREIRRSGARPALYTVWPSQRRERVFPQVVASYRAAAEAVDGLLLPVGDAWLETWQLDREIALYGSDNFHPSRLATYLAAVVMLRSFSGDSAVGLPSRFVVDGKTISFPAGTAATLQQAADTVVDRTEQAAEETAGSADKVKCP